MMINNQLLLCFGYTTVKSYSFLNIRNLVLFLYKTKLKVMFDLVL